MDLLDKSYLCDQLEKSSILRHKQIFVHKRWIV